MTTLINDGSLNRFQSLLLGIKLLLLEPGRVLVSTPGLFRKLPHWIWLDNGFRNVGVLHWCHHRVNAWSIESIPFSVFATLSRRSLAWCGWIPVRLLLLHAIPHTVDILIVVLIQVAWTVPLHSILVSFDDLYASDLVLIPRWGRTSTQSVLLIWPFSIYLPLCLQLVRPLLLVLVMNLWLILLNLDLRNLPGGGLGRAELARLLRSFLRRAGVISKWSTLLMSPGCRWLFGRMHSLLQWLSLLLGFLWPFGWIFRWLWIPELVK